MFSPTLPGFDPTDAEWVSEMTQDERIERVIRLLKAEEPEEGYYLAFSAGKDSVTIKALAQMSGVKFEAVYNPTSIDPPELIAFLREHHPDVQWNKPKHGNMMHRIATCHKVPPTRAGRWCCEEFKEYGGKGRVKIFGVRAAESPDRKTNWVEVALDQERNKAICPIVFWTTDQVWEFLKSLNVPYCKLYDEGFTRLGCIGCPLNPEGQKREFKRWPRFERNWKKAIIANWELNKDLPREDGKPRYHAKFKTGEEFWQWWLTAEAPEYMKHPCQMQLLWTNETDKPI